MEKEVKRSGEKTLLLSSLAFFFFFFFFTSSVNLIISFLSYKWESSAKPFQVKGAILTLSCFVLNVSRGCLFHITVNINPVLAIQNI